MQIARVTYSLLYDIAYKSHCAETLYMPVKPQLVAVNSATALQNPRHYLRTNAPQKQEVSRMRKLNESRLFCWRSSSYCLPAHPHKIALNLSILAALTTLNPLDPTTYRIPCSYNR